MTRTVGRKENTSRTKVRCIPTGVGNALLRAISLYTSLGSSPQGGELGMPKSGVVDGPWFMPTDRDNRNIIP